MVSSRVSWKPDASLFLVSVLFALAATEAIRAFVEVRDHRCVWRQDGSLDPWCGGPTECQNFVGHCDNGQVYQ